MVLAFRHLALVLCHAVILCGAQSPNAVCKDDDVVDRTPKYVGDPCTNDKDCVNPINQGFICKGGACACGPSYMEGSQANRSICLKRPTSSLLGQACNYGCALPYTCSLDTNRSTANQQFYKCQCPPPFKYIGNRCRKECQPDEVLMQNGDCRKKCAVDEILDEAYQCKKIADLDQPCQIDAQCQAAYSRCQSGVCKCWDGFNAAGGKCEPIAYKCLAGEAVRHPNGSVVTCEVVRSMLAGPTIAAPPGSSVMLLSRRPSGLEDTCGKDAWCQILIPTGSPPLENEGDEGFCCTKPKSVCPLGQPYAPAPYCTDPVYLNADTFGKYTSDSCPKTHECIFDGTPGPPVCCPRTCTPGQIYVNGKCYQKRQFGEYCQVDDQCRVHGGRCLQGQCKCAPNYVVSGASNPENERTCSRTCAYDEVPIGRECIRRLKLGQACKNSGQCPRDAYCNKSGVCACRCLFKQFSDTFCGPPPICSFINSTVPASNPPVFCNGTPAATTPFLSLSLADPCPDGQVCINYRSGVGLCCPKPPEPPCPVNYTSQGPCNPKAAKPCNGSAQCIMPYTPAISTDKYGGVCCLKNPAPTTTTTRKATVATTTKATNATVTTKKQNSTVEQTVAPTVRPSTAASVP